MPESELAKQLREFIKTADHLYQQIIKDAEKLRQATKALKELGKKDKEKEQ